MTSLLPTLSGNQMPGVAEVLDLARSQLIHCSRKPLQGKASDVERPKQLRQPTPTELADTVHHRTSFVASSSRPMRTAIAAASARRETPILAITFDTWTLAVLTLMKSRSPIWRLVPAQRQQVQHLQLAGGQSKRAARAPPGCSSSIARPTLGAAPGSRSRPRRGRAPIPTAAGPRRAPLRLRPFARSDPAVPGLAASAHRQPCKRRPSPARPVAAGAHSSGSGRTLERACSARQIASMDPPGAGGRGGRLRCAGGPLPSPPSILVPALRTYVMRFGALRDGSAAARRPSAYTGP